MPYEVYKIMHLAGLFLTFAAIGANTIHVANGGSKEDYPARKMVGMTHGIALMLVLVGGFGMLGSGSVQMGGWIIGKLFLWLVMGAALVLPFKAPKAAKLQFFIFPIWGAVGAFLAIYKPF